MLTSSLCDYRITLITDPLIDSTAFTVRPTAAAHAQDLASTSAMATPTSTPEQLCPLLQLPAEMQLAIIEHLRSLEKMTLRITNRHFHQLISPLPYSGLIETQEQLHTKGLGTPPFLVCKSCLRLRSQDRFPNYAYLNLWCLDCEMASKKHRRKFRSGFCIRTLGKPQFLCPCCKAFKGVADVVPKSARCVVCFEKGRDSLGTEYEYGSA